MYIKYSFDAKIILKKKLEIRSIPKSHNLYFDIISDALTLKMLNNIF